MKKDWKLKKSFNAMKQCKEIKIQDIEDAKLKRNQVKHANIGINRVLSRMVNR